MVLSNIDRIYAEYPFINEIYPRSKAWRAQVSRMDGNFFQLWNSGDPSRRFFLLDEKGKILTRVGGRGNLSFLSYIIGNKSETVGQALYRIGNRARDVHFAITSDRSSVCLYKLPRKYKDIWNLLDDLSQLEIETKKGKIQEEKRQAKIGEISDTLRYTKPGSDEENKLLILFDEMNLSFDEWDFAYRRYGLLCNWATTRPKIMERRLGALANKKGL